MSRTTKEQQAILDKQVRNLIERENQMQEYAVEILEAATRRGISVEDFAIVFGATIRGQAKANAENRGVPDIIVAEELLRKFMEGLRGVHEGPAARH